MDRDELISVIKEVIAEDRAERITHPEQRQKYTSYETPEGRTWTAVTLEKGEMLRKAVTIISTVCVFIGSLFIGYYELIISPRNERATASMIHQHELEAAGRMREEAAKYALAEDLKMLKVEKEQKWIDQDRFNARVEASLVEMQKDIKELLRRVR